MFFPVIDAHIHFDQYKKEEQGLILAELEDYQVESLISVSYDFASARENLELSKKDPRIKPAFGYHPEQSLPNENELTQLLQFIVNHHHEMVAVGEVGLPYYSKLSNQTIHVEAYIELLEEFIKLASKFNQPIVLHAIYEDAPIVINLLEKHSVKKAHFHWFKGDEKTLKHMERNGYFISFTPDLVYKEKIQTIAQNYPLTQVMVETDGPWPFEGPFQGQMTHPKMIHETIRKLSLIKKKTLHEVYHQLYRNTVNFYSLIE